MANVIKHKRGSGSDPGASDLILGELAIRTDTGKLFTKMDSGAIAEIAGGGSDIAINTLSSSSATGGGSATFNGSAYRFTLSSPPSVSAAQLLVSVNGVIQKPVAGTGQPSEGFSVSGNDIIFGDAPATGADFFILTFRSLGVSVPADNSVTSAKIVDGAIVNADINASAAIAGTKIDPDFGSQNIETTGNLLNTKSIQGLGHTAITGTPHTYYYGRGTQGGGVSIYSRESALELVSSEDSTHGGSVLLRTVTEGAGFVYNSSTNSLELKTFTPSANNFTIHGAGQNITDLVTQLRVVKSGQVELAHNGSVKLNTSSSGIDVTGNTTGTGKLQYTHTGVSNTAHFLFDTTQSTSTNNAGTLFEIKHARGDGNTSPLLDVKNSQGTVFSVTGTGKISFPQNTGQATSNMLLGHSSNIQNNGGHISKLQVSSNRDQNYAGIASVYYKTDTIAGRLILGKSKSSTIGDHAVISNNDQLGMIFFEGSDGTDFHRGAQIAAHVDGTASNNVMPGRLTFAVTNTGGSSPIDRVQIKGSTQSMDMLNNTYINIPHDERCIVFDEGQKMITSNDGQGNFNIIAGKNHDGVHVNSASGSSGISHIELQCDGNAGSIGFGVGPTRTAGSQADFTNGFKLVQFSSSSNDYLNGLQYTTGNTTSPLGLATSYNVIHSGNAANGRWNTSSTAVFKALGDGGSIGITTNDGGGNCNVCFNHSAGVPDTNGSSWRIRADIDAANSHFFIQNNKSVTSGTTASMTSRFEIDENGNGYINGSSISSDQRLKKNIKNITDATNKIKALTGRTFEWKEELEYGEGTKYGFIAQELETVLPELVSKALVHFDKDGKIMQDNYTNKSEIVDTAKTININGIVPVLVEAFKEAMSRIEALEAK